jgi:imidazolonepropionase
MTTEEIINAVTINGAAAMGLSETHGSIARGKVANFIVTASVPSLDFIPYAFTTPLVKRMFMNGVEVINGNY